MFEGLCLNFKLPGSTSVESNAFSTRAVITCTYLPVHEWANVGAQVGAKTANDIRWAPVSHTFAHHRKTHYVQISMRILCRIDWSSLIAHQTIHISCVVGTSTPTPVSHISFDLFPNEKWNLDLVGVQLPIWCLQKGVIRQSKSKNTICMFSSWLRTPADTNLFLGSKNVKNTQNKRPSFSGFVCFLFNSSRVLHWTPITKSVQNVTSVVLVLRFRNSVS